MGNGRLAGCTRRQALASAAALGALAALARADVPQAGAQRSGVSGGGGIAGGGTAETAEGEAQFSLFATSLDVAGQAEPQVFGRVQWLDRNWRSQGVTLVSTAVTAYGPPANDPQSNVRELRGTMTANGEGSHPFFLRAVVAPDIGVGTEEIRLTVGPGAVAGTPAAATPTDGFAYDVEGMVDAGDLQLLRFDAANQG